MMNKLKRIKPYVIFSDIIKCFMMSCGMVLLLCFFNYEQLSITKEMIQQSVLLIFNLLFVLLGTYEILIGNGWFSGEVVAVESSLGKAVRENPIERSKSIVEYNRKVSVVHEAGHAVMAYLEEIENFEVIMSDINPRVVMGPKLLDEKDVKKMILIMYAGAIAEKMLFGNFHSGCFMGEGNDFSKATELIKGYIVMTNPNMSKSLLNVELSEKVILLSKEFWQKAENILINHKIMIEVLSEELLKKETFSKEEIKIILESIHKDK